MSYYPQRTVVVLEPDPHAQHNTRKGVIISDVNHPDIGPNQDPQRYTVTCTTTTHNYSYQPTRLPTRGLETGMFRNPVYTMPWSIHTVEDYENNDARDTEATDEVQIIAAEGKVTEKTFARIRDGLYEYLGGTPP